MNEELKKHILEKIAEIKHSVCTEVQEGFFLRDIPVCPVEKLNSQWELLNKFEDYIKNIKEVK